MKITSVLFFIFLLGLCHKAKGADSRNAPLPGNVTNSIYYKRFLWTQEDWLSEDGHLPLRGRERGLEQIRLSKSLAAAQPKAIVPGNVWVLLGPAPIVNGQTAGSQ